MAGSYITEKYSFKTDIITSYDGREQRIATRQNPRHLVTYDYPSMNCLEAQWLRGLMRMRQSDTYFIPMWHNVIKLRENYDPSNVNLNHYLRIEEDGMYDLINCEAIEIFKQDDVNQSQNIVRRVRQYYNGMIRMREKIDIPLDTRNTFIYPLIKCSTQPSTGLQYVYSNGSNVPISFEDLLEIPPDIVVPHSYIYEYEDYPLRNRWGLPGDINGVEMFFITPQWAEDSGWGLSVEKNVNRLDNETGMFWYDLKNVKSYDVHTMQVTLMNKKEIHNMVKFFKRMKGKWKSFYAPTWVNDIDIYGDCVAGQSYIYTSWNKIKKYYLSNKREKKLVIFTKDWKSYIVDVWTYLDEKLPSGEKVGKLMLKSPLTSTISNDNILMASYLNRVRFDSDDLQLNYESNIMANTTLTLREVDDIHTGVSNTSP